MKTDKNRYFSKIEEKLQSRLKKKRYRHTIGVAHTAACLAMRYGVDSDKAYLAGLLHDVAKSLGDKDMLKAAESFGIRITAFDRECPSMLHSFVGAQIAARDFDIKDDDILRAIENHTIGRCGMSALEEIVFIADYIENGRDRAPQLKEIRELAFTDLKKCMLVILENTVKYVEASGEKLDERVLSVIEYYKQGDLKWIQWKR